MAFDFDNSDIDFDALFNPDTPSLYKAAPVMAEPSHPGDLMREIISQHGVNVTQAAKATGIQRTHLSAMLTGEKPVSIETAMKFEAAFGGPSPIVIHGMSDLYECAKAMRRRDEVVANVVRLSDDTADALRATAPGKRPKRLQETA